MTKLVTEQAQMECTLGTAPQKLTVTGQMEVKIDGGLVATEDDKQPMANIPSFGNCKCNQMQPPCVPSPQGGWQQPATHGTIKGKKKLTENSFCMCAKGGKISFKDTGKNKFIESE